VFLLDLATAVIRSTSGSRIALYATVTLSAFAITTAGCTFPRAYLTELVEARRLVADLHVQFTRSADAANRAVMADTDHASIAAAGEAQQATARVERTAALLTPLLRSMGYSAELRHLDAFAARFAEYRRLDAEILPLATQNTNLKAQHLLFGPARAASEAIRQSLEAAERTPRTGQGPEAQIWVQKAIVATLDIQVVLAPHIAAADEATMTSLEAEIAHRSEAVRQALDRLRPLIAAQGTADLDEARASWDQFVAVVREIVALSRRNSNVRSLALSLGRKRVVTVQCEEHLRALEEALQQHEFRATR
jgi:hypothetical protein